VRERGGGREYLQKRLPEGRRGREGMRERVPQGREREWEGVCGRAWARERERVRKERERVHKRGREGMSEGEGARGHEREGGGG
jgi:hypothetical protein